MRLGIDFGTTNSAAAVYDGVTLHPVHINQAAILPSLLYIDRQHQATLGSAAAQLYLQRETGRAVQWRSREIGVIEVVVSGKDAPIIYNVPVVVTFDDAASGRLLQSVKTALRLEHYEGTQIFDRFYTVDELITPLLRELKARAEAQFEQSCDEVVIGRPVKFSDDPRISLRAEEIIYKAGRAAGFRDIRFAMEPIGALYLYHISTLKRITVLVFDFGGGTLDLTVAEVGAGRPPHVLATRGVLVGGDDLDRRIFFALLKYFGENPDLGEHLPHDVLEALASWQTMNELSRSNYVETFNRLRRASRHPKSIDALKTLVSKNVGFSLFSRCEQAKRDLSDHLHTTLQFNFENIHLRELISRPRFEMLIRQELKAVEQGLHDVLAEAGLRAAQIEAVVRTGGSSLVPAFVQMLTRLFGADKLREIDPLTSVVGGLSIVAHESGGTVGAYQSKYPADPCAVTAPYDGYIMRVGAQPYSDRETTVRKIPVALSGLPAIRLPWLERERREAEYLRLPLAGRAKVYIAYPGAALQPPDWMRAWEREDMSIEVEDEWWGIKELYVYSQLFEGGEVVLGGCMAPGARGRVDVNYIMLLERYN
ncbi:MAG: Hsp70 family protein [Chloroflexi bacterium]|nr:Hsp70 family protein [Chloroflexota bacterium]